MGKINKKELHQIFGELRNKDQNAYNNLYEKYYNLVYGITYSILKNKEDSEDISHEIFTKIYKLDVDKLPTNNEASWLFTVSKNECFAFFRKTKPNLSIDEIYEIPSSSNELENVIDSEYYNKIIDRLKEDEKQIVSLKILSNFTFKKISQVMNVPIGTVQWKYYNAINSLRISVGSLVGAITAFVIIMARGEFWKSKQYMNQNQTNDVNNEENNYIIVKHNEYSKQIRLSNLEGKFNVEECVDAAYNLGRSRNIMKDNSKTIETMLSNINLITTFSYNEELLEKVINEIALELPGVATDSSYIVDNDKIIIKNSKDGIQIKTSEFKKNIIEFFEKQSNILIY